MPVSLLLKKWCIIINLKSTNCLLWHFQQRDLLIKKGISSFIQVWKVLTYETPILFLLLTRLLIICTWLAYIKENGLFAAIVVMIFSSSLLAISYFDLSSLISKARKPEVSMKKNLFDTDEKFGTKVWAVYTAIFTPCMPLQEWSYFHLWNSLLTQGGSQVWWGKKF